MADGYFLWLSIHANTYENSRWLCALRSIVLVLLGLYRDNGKWNGNYHIKVGYIGLIVPLN